MSKKNLNPDAIINELTGQSVFFQRSTAPVEETPVQEKTPSPLSQTEERQSSPAIETSTHERTDTQTHKITNARLHDITDVQTHERASAQSHERTNVHDYRIISRKTLDLYLDQIERIDELVLQRRKELKRHVTIGEVAREMVDFFFEKHS